MVGSRIAPPVRNLDDKSERLPVHSRVITSLGQTWCCIGDVSPATVVSAMFQLRVGRHFGSGKVR